MAKKAIRAKIIKLQVENIKGIKAIEINPDGSNLVIIGGKNAQGKTSILDSIVIALTGRKMPDKPIREGEDSAKILLETEDLIITKVLTAGKSPKLKVESRKGRKYSSPQSILDKLVGELTFDPLEFSKQKPLEQMETLRGLVKIDTSDLEEERQKNYTDRWAVNRDLIRVTAQVDGLNHCEGEEVSVADLLEELDTINKSNMEIKKKNTELQGLEEDYRALGGQLGIARQNVEAMVKKRNELAEEIKGSLEEILTLEDNYDNLGLDVQFHGQIADALEEKGTDEIKEKIRNAEEKNKEVRESKQRDELVIKKEFWEGESQKFTDRIDEIDAEQESMMANAKFPVPGLSFDESGVLFNGVPLGDCSSAETLRVSVGMSIALNPELGVILVRDGSLMDEESMRMIAEMAEESGSQIWIEKVMDKAAGAAVIIEDGMIKE